MERTPATPQSIDKLLATGFRLFRTGFRDILGILLTQTISVLALFVVLFSLTMSLYDNSSTTIFQPRFIIGLVMSSLLILAVQLAFIASFTAKFWACAHQTSISSAHAYAVGAQKALPLLAWLISYLLIVWTGIILFVVPGLILAVSLFMGAALIIQDHYSTPAAIKTSHKMVWPYLRRTLLYLVLSAGATLIIYFVTLYPLGLFVSYITSHNPMLNGILDIARYALIVMLVPLFIALIIPYYMDLLRLDQGQNTP